MRLQKFYDIMVLNINKSDTYFMNEKTQFATLIHNKRAKHQKVVSNKH